MTNSKQFIQMTEQEFDTFMCQTFPVFFKQRNMPMSETCMCWGFSIGAGWYETLYNLCLDLDKICKKYKIELQFTQIKEKYGGGRFYYDLLYPIIYDSNLADEGHKIISDLIAEAENKVEKICETCGKPTKGPSQNHGWVYAMCDECKEKRNKRKQ